jgi:ATP-dependent 26S proteasome regulatory subunit
MHRFLAIADGIMRAQGRKIIFTTNLPNIHDMDQALVRPGRCFKVIHTRPLDDEEVERLIARLCGADATARLRARERLAPGARGATVAEVYQACAAVPVGPAR